MGQKEKSNNSKTDKKLEEINQNVLANESRLNKY